MDNIVFHLYHKLIFLKNGIYLFLRLNSSYVLGVATIVSQDGILSHDIWCFRILL